MVTKNEEISKVEIFFLLGLKLLNRAQHKVYIMHSGPKKLKKKKARKKNLSNEMNQCHGIFIEIFFILIFIENIKKK